MNENTIPFKELVTLLLDGETSPTSTQLHQFSDIETAELAILLDAWPRIDLTRKEHLLDQMDALAASNTILSYDALARALLVDADPSIRSTAIRLLDESDDVSLIPLFLKILRTDAVDRVRAEAATALGIFVFHGELDEIASERHKEVEDALLEAARDAKQSEVQRRAIESLGFSSRAEVPALLENAYWREDPKWTASAVFAMGRSYDERWKKEVLASLLNDNREIRLAAAKSAGELELDEARKILLEMLEDEDDEAIFNAVIWSLSQIGGEDVRTYIENFIDQFADDDSEMVDFLEDALANLGFTDDFQELDMLAFDPDDPFLLDD